MNLLLWINHKVVRSFQTYVSSHSLSRHFEKMVTKQRMIAISSESWRLGEEVDPVPELISHPLPHRIGQRGPREGVH